MNHDTSFDFLHSFIYILPLTYSTYRRIEGRKHRKQGERCEMAKRKQRGSWRRAREELYNVLRRDFSGSGLAGEERSEPESGL
jgi:hypothetical protein